MDSGKREIFEALVELEKNLEVLYLFFAGLFPDDSDFWRILAGEEKKHAQILEANSNSLPQQLLKQRLEEIKLVNGDIREYILTCKNSQPFPGDALNMAYLLESSSGEAHYQIALENESWGEVTDLFKKLNEADKDHAIRIQKYIKSKFQK
jgi:hypothetical protein